MKNYSFKNWFGKIFRLIGGRIFFAPLLIFSLTHFQCDAKSGEEVFIRANQHGFLPEDIKTAVLFANHDLKGEIVSIRNLKSNKIVFKDTLAENLGALGNFDFHHSLNFSSLILKGNYQIEFDKYKSQPFEISKTIYNGMVDSLLLFLKVQRCGPTNPLLHEVCHLFDATSIIGDESVAKVDLTGGWHDAADYIKFTSTTAYTSYMLLFAYQFFPSKLEMDNNKNGAPDILEEARVGIDWLLRAQYKPGRLITQVQSLNDHDAGWRLPEDDPLNFDRPGFVGIGKNQIGLYTAALSLAAKIWKERFYDNDYSQQCLKAAQTIYAQVQSAPDIDTSYSGMYQDQKFYGKLALGAIELFNSTGEKKYLDDAMIFGDSAKSDYWWSWGDINSIAHYKISKHNARYKNYIFNNLVAFQNNLRANIFGEPTATTWGTTTTFMGAALSVLLWKEGSKDNSFDSLIYFSRDYLLGKNPWGKSFIYNFGEVFAKSFHNQISFLNGEYLPGAVTAGPAPASLLMNYNIERTNLSDERFNSEQNKFFDDRADYVTNEPTIVTNATAIFFFTYFLK